MQTKILHQEILDKKEKLNNISAALKKTFIGLDSVIDEIMNLVSTWYIFPKAQLRPTVINLWGMTGSGKTALIQKLVELLDHKKLYAQMDMGEFESDSASWIKAIFTDELAYFHEQAGIICLDEFQFARTLDNGRELGKDKLRVIWDLLDSGKLTYIPGGNTFMLRRSEIALMNLLKAKETGVCVENGIVVKNSSEFLELFKGFYFNRDDRDGATMDANYFLSEDFLKGLYYLYDDDTMTREILDEKVKKAGIEQIIALIVEGVKTRTGVKQLDLSGALIFVLGNLDEAYHMSNSLNPDISADELHEATTKINISHIKGALKKRFRNEQIARLGNNHVIYKSFNNAHFCELIKRELERVNEFVESQFNFSLIYDDSVHTIVYKEGVFPAQGTRPVLTTIKNLIESWISKIAVVALEKNMPVANVEWSYDSGKYVFVYKDQNNTILNIYEEKIELKVDSLRKTTDRNIQAYTAVHEAGHAVLAALTLKILPSLIVSKTAGDNCDGFCMVNFPEGATTKDLLRKDIIITLGGFVAEKMIFGEEQTSSGVYSDLEYASALANKAIKYYGMGKDPIHIAVQAADNNEAFFIKDIYHQEAMQLIKESCTQAEILLERNKLVLLKIAEYLTNHNKMEEKEIGEYLKLYGVEEWITQDGFVKKENYFDFEKYVRKHLAEIELTF